MVKHFEHLWEEAELVADEFYKFKQGDTYENVHLDIINNIINIKNNEQPSPTELSYKIGKMIFALCFISKIYDINVYGSLREVIDDAKMLMLDEGISHE